MKVKCDMKVQGQEKKETEREEQTTEKRDTWAYKTGHKEGKN